MLKLSGLVVMCILGLNMGLATSGSTGLDSPAPLDFGLSSISRVAPGTAYVYDVVVGEAWPHPSGLMHPRKVLSVRILVTDVQTTKDATELKARVDRVDKEWPLAPDGLYRLVLMVRGDRGKVTVKEPLGGESMLTDTVADVPSFLVGYPDLVVLPRDGGPEIRSGHGLRTAARWSVAAGSEPGQVSVNVEYFREMYDTDLEKHRSTLYWVRDGNTLQSTVPLGQEAAPPLSAKVDVPRLPDGSPKPFNVIPVCIDQTEEQTWDQGAAFPKKIVRRAASGLLMFEATLKKVEQVPLEPEAADAEPAATGEASPTAPSE